MGKLIIIDGIDGSGKTTQLAILSKRLTEQSVKVECLKFPQYDKPSATLLNMYLQGEFGKAASDVNAYAASTFFAVDRYASYKLYWKAEYDSDCVIISDRYVSSNLIHQGSKLSKEEAHAFFEWVYDFEYQKLGLPVPDAVLFLDVPPSVSVKQLEKRYSGDENKKDIHEKDKSYLQQCYETALYACEKGYMKRVACVENGKMKSVNEISDIIFGIVTDIL